MKHTKQESTMGTSPKPQKKSGLASVSLLIALLDRLASAIYNAVSQSFLCKILTAYSKEQAAFEECGIRKLMQKPQKLVTWIRKIRYLIANTLENSLALQGCRRLGKKLLLLPASSYGNFLLSFGIYTILVYVVRLLVPGLEAGNSDHLIIGVAICVVSIPLLFAKAPVLSTVKNGKLTRAFFITICGFREESFLVPAEFKKIRGSFLVILGMFCGLLTLFVSPLFILGLLLFFVGCALLFTMPEIGVLISLFLLPFLSLTSYPSFALAGIVFITFIGYFFKLLRGKRLFKFELIDATILLFAIILLFSGIFSAGGVDSLTAAIMSVILMLGYFLVVNLMRTAKWIKRCVSSLVLSSIIVAVIGVFEYLFGELNLSWLDRNYFPNIKGRVVSLFENSNVLGTYLVMVFPLALFLFVRQTKSGYRKFLFFGCVSLLACNILTWSRGAWLAMLISCSVFFLIYSKKTFRFLVVFGLTIPLWPTILPDNVVTRFLSIGDLADTSTMYRVYTWKGTLAAIEEHLFEGVGYGTEAYQLVYPSYAYTGMEGAEHSHSLFLQVLFAMGICGLIVLIAVLLFSFQQSSEFIRYEKNEDSRLMVAAALSSLIAAIVMGLVDYIWYNYRVFFLFWIILALACSYIRVQKEEERRKRTEHDTIDSSHASIDWSV